jgi:formylglycine-generating enzyme required for sulfatase activity
VFVPATPKQGFSMGMGEQTQQYMKGLRLPPGVKAFDTPHRVVLTKPFCMDALEVIAKDYDACVAKGACTGTKIAMWTTSGGRHPTLPINNVDWKQSRAYCKSLGKDLPTEAQWEWAARGDDGRTFPWGNEPATCEHADFTPGVLEAPAANTGCNGGNASVGGSHPKGDRVWPAGRIHDLAGNVWEWTLDNTAPYGTDELTVDPLVVTDLEKSHMVRGGAWNRSEVGIKSAYRGSAVVGYQRPGLGFRCVRNPLK